MGENTIKWLKREIRKDELKLRNHKKTLISQIKKDGIEGVLQRPQKKKKNISLWKKLKNLLSF
jgi:hypothetical protein